MRFDGVDLMRPPGLRSLKEFAEVPNRSRYELHDKYTALLTTKSGTRYERLTAIVFKALQESHVVILVWRVGSASPNRCQHLGRWSGKTCNHRVQGLRLIRPQGRA